MIYLREYTPSEQKVNHPNLYPYNALSGKFSEPLEFSEITVFYGENGCGKSTLLNLIALKLGIDGAEEYCYGQMFIDRFNEESSYSMAYNEKGIQHRVPENSRYIKSEDMLYEIKKIQQEKALRMGYVYEAAHLGADADALKRKLFLDNSMNFLTFEGKLLFDKLKFRQEKYSNGETSLQIFENFLQPDAIYLLDEPEASLSLQSQLKLADMINDMARFFNCQFIIATHSPLMLSKFHGMIYDFDHPTVRMSNWYELGNVRFMYDFFMNTKDKFE